MINILGPNGKFIVVPTGDVIIRNGEIIIDNEPKNDSKDKGVVTHENGNNREQGK